MSQMRWFTDEAYAADDQEAWDAMLASYQAHAAAIAGSLPADLAALATDPSLSLHDARIRRLEVDRDGGTVTMTVLLADGRQMRLGFGDAAFDPDNLEAVAYAVGATYATDHWGTTHTEVLAHEVDVAPDGRFLLRLRLWPFGEFGLLFRSFSLGLESAADDDGSPGKFVLSDDGLGDD